MNILKFFFLLAMVAAQGFWDIQINLQSLKSVPFGSAHVSVWEHASTAGRYFASPLVCLQPDTATVLENFFTGRTQLDFSVLLWSMEAKEAVYSYMKDHVNASIVRDQIELLPMEKIRLVWQNRQNLPDFYQVGDDWRSNSHLPTLVRFNIACQDLQKCRVLEAGMKTTPHAFNGLELEYQINAQKTARRRLVVKGDHLIGGELYTSLVNMPVQTGIRFLTSDDVTRLASETTTNVLATLTTDEDYDVDENEEVSLMELLRTVLQRQVVSTEEFQPRMWESVFWDSDVARPDKVTKYLNKILTIDVTNTSSFLLNQSERDVVAETSFGLLGISSTGGGSVSRVEKADVVNTLIQQKHHDVEWSGQRFLVKPMRLSRLNLASLNQSVTIATTRIQVKQFDSVKSIKLRTNCYARNQTSRMAVSPEEFTRSSTSITGNGLETVLNATLESQMLLGNRLESILNSTVEFQSQLGNELETALNKTVHKMFDILPKPEWPEYCFISGYYCNLTHFRFVRDTPLSECRDLCNRDSRCGTIIHRESLCWLERLCPPDNIIKSTRGYNLCLKMSEPFLRLKFSYHYITNGSWPMVASGGPCKVLGSEWMSA